MAEAGRIWELSDYEKQRQPHPIITDDTPIAVPPSALQNELLCPICLDILNQTMTTKACLHRFCRECIMTAMRNGNKECPTCRKKLQSKRDLHPDATFDALIAKLFPNRSICSGFGPDPDVPSTSAASNSEPRISGDVSRTLLRKQEEKMAKQGANSSIKIALSATSTSNNNSTQNGDTAGSCSTNQSSKAASKKPVAPTASATNEEEEDDSDDDDDREVELLLKPLVKSAAGVSNSTASSAGINQETRCLKTTPKATIAHIAKYLALRRQVEADRCTETQVSDDDDTDGAGCEYEIFAKARDARFVTLESTATLRRTAELYAAVPPSATAGANANANAQIKLVLFYKLRRESAANNSNCNTDSTSQPKRAKHDASSN